VTCSKRRESGIPVGRKTDPPKPTTTWWEQGAKPGAPRSTFNTDHAKRMEVLMPRVEIPRGGVVPKLR
jgi:hypothetical protein